MATPPRLNTFAQGTVSAAGVATASLVVPRSERWHVTNITVLTNQASTVTTMPIATVYIGQVSDSEAIGSTYTGARDSGSFDFWLEGAETLIGRWTGGVAGTIATMSIMGERVYV